MSPAAAFRDLFPGRKGPTQPLFRRAVQGAAHTKEWTVKSYILLALAVATLSGCATVGGARAVATPWGVGGLYSFRDKPAVVGEPSQRSVDIQVAKALDNVEQRPTNEDVRVAGR
jgi:hypothetical protein